MRTYHKHGMTKSSEFYTWNHMKDRCLNPRNGSYKYYGGKGIKVCDRWRDSFPNFLSDMGRKPSPAHTIDRIDHNKDYEPSNCKWALMSEQNQHKSNAAIVEFNGQRKSLTEWASIQGISVKTIRSRLRYGWTIERALTK